MPISKKKGKPLKKHQRQGIVGRYDPKTGRGVKEGPKLFGVGPPVYYDYSRAYPVPKPGGISDSTDVISSKLATLESSNYVPQQPNTNQWTPEERMLQEKLRNDLARQEKKGKSGYDKMGYPNKAAWHLTKENSETMKKAAPKQQKKGGSTSSKQMIKRADGSYSQRGLWDNIRANKGSGRKPTAEMLKQERKIKAKSKKK